eukprot:CAMPEP_0194030894 /NCGR_PEP_ID=MMETSP0009_2-20130614/4215_1 /TAXON_ID=210454 /ORGANISM="Grammatophora oceanica, Strain CCMP 410" /LENGTH=215 /DNA_ID=CAMNT_0038670919 /DNA_START=163 /DNA_END=807 /DNA_ORIENTATION=+
MPRKVLSPTNRTRNGISSSDQDKVNRTEVAVSKTESTVDENLSPASSDYSSPTSSSGKPVDETRSPSNEQQRCRRQVRFNEVQVRYFDYKVDDNPAVSDGPALTFCWDPADKDERFTVDLYDAFVSLDTRGNCIRLPISSRYELLQRSGSTPREIIQAVKRSGKARARRLMTRQQLRTAARGDGQGDHGSGSGDGRAFRPGLFGTFINSLDEGLW